MKTRFSSNLSYFSGVVLSIILAGFLLPELKAQQPDSLPKAEPKTYRVFFNVDIALKGLSARENYYYQGEYFNDFDIPAEWEWRETDETRTNFLQNHKFKAFRLEMLLALYKHLRVGFSYNGIILNTPRRSEESSFYPFFAMAAVANYTYPLKSVPGMYVDGSFSFGTYQSNEIYQGTGRELFYDARLGIGYIYKEKAGIRLYGASNWLTYRDRSQSGRFQQEQTVKIDWHMLHLGIGLTYQINFIPD